MNPDPCRVLFLGNVIPRKGLHTLIAALVVLSREAWQLTVVGSLEIDLPYVRQVRHQLADAGLDGRVEPLPGLSTRRS